MTIRSIVVALSAAGFAAMSLSAAVAVAAADNTGGATAPRRAATAAAPAADPSPTPTYRFVGDYGIARTACVQAGQAGVDSGEWDAFRCLAQRAGLDLFW